MPLHPVYEALIEAARKAGRPALSAGSPDDTRALVASTRSALGAGPTVERIDEMSIPARAGHVVPARLYRPSGSVHGLIVYLHGGGWLAGAPDDFDVLARALAVRSACALLLVDYRLAPEHPFPAGLEDTEDALLWAAASRVQLLGRALPLVVAGDSAGANLATVALLALRGKIDVALQLLFYPVTDCDTDTPSYREHATGLPLTRADMAWFIAHYAPRSQWTNPRVAPLRAPDLAGLPPAWIATAEYDVLHDEGVAYAQRLAVAGVAVELHDYAGLAHGFARMVNLIDAADRAVSEAAEAIARHCGGAQDPHPGPLPRAGEGARI